LPEAPLTAFTFDMLGSLVKIHQLRLHPKKVIDEDDLELNDDKFSNRFD
jgi:hypothetical protein